MLRSNSKEGFILLQYLVLLFTLGSIFFILLGEVHLRSYLFGLTTGFLLGVYLLLKSIESKLPRAYEEILDKIFGKIF